MARVLQASDFYGAGKQYPISSGVVVSEGDLVAIDSAGSVVLADHDAPVQCHGVAVFVDDMGTKAARTGVAGLTVKCCVAKRAVVDGLSSLTIGGNIYTSDTAGGYTGSAPTTDTFLRQVVGVAIAADRVDVWITPGSDLKVQTAANSQVAFI